MIDNHSTKDVVLSLVRVVSGESPRLAVEAVLDPRVLIHMDSANHRGIETWYKWIHLIRNCGRFSKLRMTCCNVQCDARDPQLIHLSIRWAGNTRSTNTPCTSTQTAHMRYRVRDGRIVEIWTHKANYEFIFGSWIGYSFFYRLFLGWAILYFMVLSVRGRDYHADRVVEEAVKA